jgi:hypothetical protein
MQHRSNHYFLYKTHTLTLILSFTYLKSQTDTSLLNGYLNTPGSGSIAVLKIMMPFGLAQATKPAKSFSSHASSSELQNEKLDRLLVCSLCTTTISSSTIST